MLSNDADNQTDGKAADDVDRKGAKWESTAKFWDCLPEEIAADRTERTAQPDSKQIHSTFSAHR